MGANTSAVGSQHSGVPSRACAFLLSGLVNQEEVADRDSGNREFRHLTEVEHEEVAMPALSVVDLGPGPGREAVEAFWAATEPWHRDMMATVTKFEGRRYRAPSQTTRAVLCTCFLHSVAVAEVRAEEKGPGTTTYWLCRYPQSFIRLIIGLARGMVVWPEVRKALTDLSTSQKCPGYQRTNIYPAREVLRRLRSLVFKCPEAPADLTEAQEDSDPEDDLLELMSMNCEAPQ